MLSIPLMSMIMAWVAMRMRMCDILVLMKMAMDKVMGIQKSEIF